jgi:hypothetical protein
MIYDAETIYFENYNPPNYRYIYYETFIKLRKRPGES